MSKTKTSMNFFALTYLAWGLSEIFLAVFTRSGKSDRKGADQQSQLIIWIAIIASITLSVFVARRFPCAIFPEERMAVAGIIVLCLGILLRFIAIRQLGRFFTVDVTIREDHQLMDRGFSNMCAIRRIRAHSSRLPATEFPPIIGMPFSSFSCPYCTPSWCGSGSRKRCF